MTPNPRCAVIPARPQDPEKRYEHGHHAGNAADVIKHVALRWWLGRVLQGAGVTVVDTHAASGFHRLKAEGREWQEGVGRVLATAAESRPPLVRGLLESAPLAGFVGASGELSHYPGSPLQIATLLRGEDRLVACEIEPATHAVLEKRLARSAATEARQGDGLAFAVEAAGRGRVAAVVDPPFATRAEWDEVGAAVVAMAQRGAAVLLWYPIKGRSRPGVLRGQLAASGMAWDYVEAHWSGVTSNRLGGCGLAWTPASGPEPWGERSTAALLGTVGWLAEQMSLDAGWEVRGGRVTSSAA